MTAPASSGSVYGDFAGLEKLKSSVRQNDPAAVRQVAKQFESLFARMLIKSMRDAIGRDPIFGSDQAQTYQGMFDDQLSLELTRGHGLGLADMLVRQLRQGAGASAMPAQSATGAKAVTAPTSTATTNTPAPAVRTDQQRSFIREVWPQAQAAAQQLGVHPVSLVAQAALESNWGQSVPQGSGGESSNNLFGIKAGRGWTGSSVSARTQEYRSASALSTTAAFRAYDSPEQSFQDYVATLRSSPRFASALNSGADVHAFATALQQGGYATDPRYANKLTAVAAQVASLLGGGGAHETSFKLAGAGPITDGTAAL